MSASEILTAIDRAGSSLTRGEIEQIQQRCRYWLQRKTASARVTLEDEDWLLAGLLTELRRRGLDNRDQFRPNASFTTQSARVREMLDQLAPGLTLVERRYLGEVAARALADYINRFRDLNIGTLTQMVSSVPTALDRSFPGYIAAGMLPVLVRTLHDGNGGKITSIDTGIHRDVRGAGQRRQREVDGVDRHT